MNLQIALRALLALALDFSENELTFVLQCQDQSSYKNEDKLGRSPKKKKKSLGLDESTPPSPPVVRLLFSLSKDRGSVRLGL